MKPKVLIYYIGLNYYQVFHETGYFDRLFEDYQVEVLLDNVFTPHEVDFLREKIGSTCKVHYNAGYEPHNQQLRRSLLMHLYYLRWFEFRHRSNALQIKKKRLSRKRQILYYSLSSPPAVARTIIKVGSRLLGLDRQLLRMVQSISPDLICLPTDFVALNTFNILQVAQSLNTKTCAMVAGWDHLVSKGALFQIPDAVAVWGEAGKREAHEIQLIPNENIRVIGAPHFFRYFDQSDREECRREIHAQYNIPADHKLILVAGSAYPFDEFHIMKFLDHYRTNNPDAKLSVIFRPHPFMTNRENEKHFDTYGFRHVRMDISMRPGYEKRFGRTGEYDPDEKSKMGMDIHYQNKLLKATDLLVGPYSTFMLEAAINRTPVLAIGYDDGINEWRVTMTQMMRMQHIVDFLTFPGVFLCRRQEDFPSHFERALQATDNQEMKNSLHEAAKRIVYNDSTPISLRFKNVVDDLLHSR